MDARVALLVTAFRHQIGEANIEAGYERFAALSPEPVGFDSFREEVAKCLAEGLIREPVRLPPGALQCHWRLELTPAGVAEGRRLSQSGGAV